MSLDAFRSLDALDLAIYLRLVCNLRWFYDSFLIFYNTKRTDWESGAEVETVAEKLNMKRKYRLTLRSTQHALKISRRLRRFLSASKMTCSITVNTSNGFCVISVAWLLWDTIVASLGRTFLVRLFRFFYGRPRRHETNDARHRCQSSEIGWTVRQENEHRLREK